MADPRSALAGARAGADGGRRERSGVYKVFTPDQCVDLGEETGRLILHPLMGGMSPQLGWESLRLFESEVLPRLR